MEKKITKATFKSFVKKNLKNLYSVCFSDFDGMQDCVTAVEQKLAKVTTFDWSRGYGDCGMPNVWLCGGGDDRFGEIEYKGMKGIQCYNCCGHWAVVTKQ